MPATLQNGHFLWQVSALPARNCGEYSYAVQVKQNSMRAPMRSKWLAICVLSCLFFVFVQPAQAQLEEAAAAYQIYKTYQEMISILQSGNPTPEDKILAELGTIKAAMQSIDSKLQTLDQEVAQLTYLEKRDAYLQLLQKVQQNEAMAQTASQQILEWVQTGKTDPNKLSNAENNSQLAANILMQQSYYMRPGGGPNDPDIFEYRTTLLPYLYALTVRLGVVILEQPQFRRFSSYTDEFNNHVTWLKQIPPMLEAEIMCQNAKQIDPSAEYAIYSHCVDTLSGYESAINGESGNGWNPLITPWAMGSDSDANNAFAYYTFYDRWKVQEEMGEHAVQNILPSVIHAATPWSRLEVIETVLDRENNNGPLSSGGKCLDSRPGFSLRSDCNRRSPTQQWVVQPGRTAPISATNPPSARVDICIEVYRWQSASNVDYPERCSGSSGERWTLTNANEVRWGRDSTLCMQNDQGLHPCNGAANQKWFRTWPPPFVRAPGVAVPHP
jgi:hypothetical protein